MTNSNNVLTGLLALNDANLTTSQRNQCLTLYALQDDSFGMFSQWLYSRSLERENTQHKAINELEQEIEKINSFKDFLINENHNIKKLVLEKQEEISNLELTLFEDLFKLKSQENYSQDENLLEVINTLENFNKILLQSLYQSMLEIQKLIAQSN